MTQGSSHLLEIHDEVNTNHGVLTSRGAVNKTLIFVDIVTYCELTVGVERGNAQLEDQQTTVQLFSVVSELDGQPTCKQNNRCMAGNQSM